MGGKDANESQEVDCKFRAFTNFSPKFNFSQVVPEVYVMNLPSVPSVSCGKENLKNANFTQR